MPRPLPSQPDRKAPEVTAEGLKYKTQGWVDDVVVGVGDALCRYGKVVEDEENGTLTLTTLDGKKFRISITTAVEVVEDA